MAASTAHTKEEECNPVQYADVIISIIIYIYGSYFQLTGQAYEKDLQPSLISLMFSVDVKHHVYFKGFVLILMESAERMSGGHCRFGL